LPLTQTSKIVDFIAPFLSIKETDGAFSYLLMQFTFGRSNREGFVGDVDPAFGDFIFKVDIFQTPLPGALPLMASGFALLMLFRRFRPKSTALS
jgi:hypothetical protein